MKLQKNRVKMYVIDMLCEECPDGRLYYINDTQGTYNHICNKCNKMKILDSKYPVVEYKPVLSFFQYLKQLLK